MSVASPVARVSADSAAATCRVRDAVPADNAALIALADACPMHGEISLCVSRAPDFFALNRLEGDRWRVGVSEGADGAVIGCVAVAQRSAYVRGRPARVTYASDLKVHPAHRGGPSADALEEYVRAAAAGLGGADDPIWLAVLAGNRAMERRAAGPRGTPVLARFATVRAHAVSLLWRRPPPRPDVTVSPGADRDLEEMAALWARVAPGRQLAPVYDAASLAAWIAGAPALDVGSYWLARRRDGRLAGWMGLWDQSRLKALRVTAYSRRLAAFRAAFNAAAPLAGAAPLPPPGGVLRHLTAVHVCVPAGEPGVLRALVLHAYRALHGSPYSFFTVGLDVRDPLSAALRGLLAQPTDVHAYVSAPSGRYTGPPLDDRPLHHEIALV